MTSYTVLFISALMAATILPMQSEAVLVGLLVAGQKPVAYLLIIATLGNVLGAVINWGLGRALRRFERRSWFPASHEQMQRAQRWYLRYGRWSLLASWLPMVGDPITVVAGALRENFWPFVALVTLAKGGRYIVLAAMTVPWL
ncbi:Inner membrane protein YqaA [Rhodobacteraceae bacterium IMCC1933]|nr:DedA family protein [Planktomarina sp.]MDP4063329.1 Inner membrane protein YqaA [Rhodobacteraceae bacterium IMCC1923]MDP4067407.1 Inner membrane protein YqaA [Rhodobacteraceae bacterium IMCC1933]MDP4070608.1 Inner membrane protein YqaA [Rhodobacteraceae bacterium IMCC1909]